MDKVDKKQLKSKINNSYVRTVKRIYSLHPFEKDEDDNSHYVGIIENINDTVIPVIKLTSDQFDELADTCLNSELKTTITLNDYKLSDAMGIKEGENWILST